nr:restriction endonuclease [Actinomycetospora corticicola]
MLRHHASGLGQRELLELPVYRQRLNDERGARGQSSRSHHEVLPLDTLDGPPEVAPKEQIADGVERLHGDVAHELLERLRSSGPDLLEHAVVDLLVTMGYGRRGERPRITGSGDGGLDGVIDQDPLGLGRIYVQAKRYAADNVVGRPAIQGFVGALHGQQANQGVFITTSSFSREAGDYAQHVNAAVVLVDGKRLTDLMIQYRVGVQIEQTYTVVKVDEDYFEL